MIKVMNNSDLKREIWSYLRKKAKKQCNRCNCVCVWDKQIIKYYNNFLGYDIICKNCVDCFKEWAVIYEIPI